jgi:hypothetical protein
MRYFIGLCVIALAVAMLAGGLLTWPAQARPCEALDGVIAVIEDRGGVLVDLIDVRSDHFDQLLVVVVGDKLLIGGVKAGCMASPPLPLDSVAPVTPA